ncbi:tRNA modification GTPase MnmE [Rubripirellula lacrimiformis]|uniref:tRNA modification GTPase MnmE n=1 Tax=Rubripirellula lacrimiformis TaxID=1930273 RepID=A0A517NJ29_9BACT|nr:GTPase [Rubripirellula lacrimiformis]QDT07135.1 tRNA modification GTPase MnmE [Rubripirellula lacrimiformis]
MANVDRHSPSVVAPAGETFASIITGVGRSAVAVIAVYGDRVSAIVQQHFLPATTTAFRPGQIRYGIWGQSSVQGAVAESAASELTASPSVAEPSTAALPIAGESIVVVPIADDRWEIHCHGGVAATDRVMDDLTRSGVHPQSPQQYTQHMTPSVLVAEAHQVLSQCVTTRTAAIALAQVRGAMVDWATGWRDRINAALVAGQSTSPDRLPGDARLPDDGRASDFDAIRHEAAQMTRRAQRTVRLADPSRVVLVGAPNVGKSSLVNAIVGYNRSITMDIAGTTRDVLHADTVIDGLPIRLSDTAGIRSSQEPIEREGIHRARTAASQADLVIRVHEPQTTFPRHDSSMAASADSREIDELDAGTGGVPVIHVMNKVDRLADWVANDSGTKNSVTTDSVTKDPVTKDPAVIDPDWLPTVATTGQGIDDLMQTIAARLSDGLPPAGAPAAICPRQADVIAAIATATELSTLPRLIEELL